MADSLVTLIKGLTNARFELEPEDIADILWLARALPAAPVPEPPVTPAVQPESAPPPPSGQPAAGPPPSVEGAPPAVQPQPAPVDEKQKPAEMPAVSVPPRRAALAAKAGSGALGFRTPRVEAIPDKLRYSRALRPLTRRIPSLYDLVLDEAATVQRIADQGIWQPVMTSALTRWLELDVIVDQWRSMALAQDTVREFLHLLENLGAFTSIQIWGMETEVDKTGEPLRLHIHPGYGPCSDQQHQDRDPKELISSQGQGLVIVLSDCISPAWYNGLVGHLLAGWGDQNMVLLVQTLPRDMWKRTGLVNALPSRLRYPCAGASNQSLESLFAPELQAWIKKHQPEWPDPQFPPFLQLPVTAVDPRALGVWAQALAGKTSLWTTGYWVPTDNSMEERRQKTNELLGVKKTKELKAKERKERYDANATLLARRLAGYLAAVPLSLPVMRLVQAVMLPESGAEHLAEFFLGGLIYPRPPDPGDTRGVGLRIEYDFYHDENSDYDLRKELLLSVHFTERSQVWEPVAEYIRQHLGQAADFSALVADPAFAEPFALVGLDALQAMGGSYATLAQEIESRQLSAPPGTTVPLGQTVKPPEPDEAKPGVETKPPEAEAPISVDDLVLQARAAMKQEQWLRALDLLTTARDKEPENNSVRDVYEEAARGRRLAELYRTGMDYYENGEWEAALDAFAEVKDIQPGYKNVDDLIMRVVERRLAEKSSEFALRAEWPDLSAHYQELISVLLQLRVTFFLGNGINMIGRPKETPWERGKYPPNDVELARYLAETIGFPADKIIDLHQVAGQFIREQGKGPLYERLHSIFEADYPPTPMHTFLAQLPAAMRARTASPHYPLIITTCYDDILERAFREVGEPFDVVTYIAEGAQRGRFMHLQPDGKAQFIANGTENPVINLDERTVILKLLGGIDREDAKQDSYIIAQDQFAGFVYRGREEADVPAQLLKRLDKSSVLYLGYSLYNQNQRLVLDRVMPRGSNYRQWAVRYNLGEDEPSYWKERGVEIFHMPHIAYLEGLQERLSAWPVLSTKPQKSKLGYYFISVSGVDASDYISRAQPRVVVSMEHNLETWRACKRASPNTFIVGRYYVDDAEQVYADDPETRAERFFKAMLSVAEQMKGVYDAWVGYNEPMVNSEEDARRLSRFYARWGDLMRDVGFRSCAYSFAAGSPDLNYWRILAEGLRHCDYLALHEYSAPTMDEKQSWLCLRYRRVVDALPADARRPVIITECGIDGSVISRPQEGWSDFTDEVGYLRQLQWYDGELQKDEYVVGAAIFTVSAWGRAGSFSIRKATRIWDYIGQGGSSPPLPVEPPQKVTHLPEGERTHAFDPAENGFSFVNYWTLNQESDARMRQEIDARVVPSVASLAESISLLAPFRGTLEKTVAGWVRQSSLDAYGMCGGMAFAALDYYIVRRPLPNPPSPRTDLLPPELRQYIFQRNLDSVRSNLARVLTWIAVLHLLPFATGRRLLSGWSREEFRKLQERISATGAWPIALVGDSTDPAQSHQVVAYRCETGERESAIYVYDPNRPGKGWKLGLDLTGMALEAAYEGTADLSQPWRGFFCTDYMPVVPPSKPPEAEAEAKRSEVESETPGKITFPSHIFGMHDSGAEGIISGAGKTGWTVITIKVNPPDFDGDFSAIVRVGLTVIIRLNNGYNPDGTIPHSAQYDEFARQCADFVAASKGARIWIIGNETNLAAERPGGEGGEVITPDKYAQCFAKCRAAIKNLPGHADDWVVPSAPAPWNPETAYSGNLSGDWVKYFQDVLNQCVQLNAKPDAISMHTYTHGLDPSLITNNHPMDAPFQNRQFEFRTYRDFMSAIPASLKSLPVFITETCPSEWRNRSVGWIQAAYAEINAWNAVPTNQPIQALCLFRWQTAERSWSISDKPALQDDLRQALRRDYGVRWPVSTTPPPPPSNAPLPATHSLAIAAQSAAQKLTWMPINDQATLYKFAQANNLGDPQTDEFEFQARADTYLGQVYNQGIVYVKKGDWGNCHWAKKRGEIGETVSDGWCPFAAPKPIVSNNFRKGRSGQKVIAVVLHVTSGELASVFPMFNNPKRGTSAHFCVGKKGEIEQYVSINDTAYANGLIWKNRKWSNSQGIRINPSWIDLIPKMNPDQYTISIEHEGKPDDKWTDAMYDANNRILQWIAQETGIKYVIHRTLIGYHEINPVDRSNCPGPNVEWKRIAVDANRGDTLTDQSAGVATAAQAAAQKLTWMPINDQATLYKFAQANNLGDPQTDEFEFTVGDDGHVGQVFHLGIVVVKKGDWGNCAWVKKP